MGLGDQLTWGFLGPSPRDANSVGLKHLKYHSEYDTESTYRPHFDKYGSSNWPQVVILSPGVEITNLIEDYFPIKMQEIGCTDAPSNSLPTSIVLIVWLCSSSTKRKSISLTTESDLDSWLACNIAVEVSMCQLQAWASRSFACFSLLDPYRHPVNKPQWVCWKMRDSMEKILTVPLKVTLDQSTDNLEKQSSLPCPPLARDAQWAWPREELSSWPKSSKCYYFRPQRVKELAMKQQLMGA